MRKIEEYEEGREYNLEEVREEIKKMKGGFTLSLQDINKKEEYETYNLEKLKKELSDKYKGQYKIVEKNAKKEYKFPFQWRTKYTLKIEIMDMEKKRESERKKQTILEALKKEPEGYKIRQRFEKEAEIKSYLLEQEVEEEIVDGWFEQLRTEEKTKLTEETVLKRITEKMIDTLNQNRNDELDGVCLFFGVTGIGKTTTVVKVAKKIEKRKKVGIITTDNYKMGAYNQIEQYAHKLNISLKKSKVNEMDFPINAMRYTDGKEVVLIDTAGRSPKHPEMKDEIENYINEIKPDRKILVLSANQKYKDLIYTIEVFKEVGITDFLVTKTDETNTYGFMVNVVEKFGKGILYVTDGQEVPTDIKEFSGEEWARRIFSEYKK